MNNDVMFSSKNNEHGTPDDLYDQLNKEFNFNLDPCATPENAKCKNYFTVKEDGLSQPWTGNVFVNPPYGRSVGKWVQKSYLEAQNGATVVCLLATRTDTKWWHSWIWDSEKHRPRKGVEVRFLSGRLKFKGNKEAAPFPSVIVVFRKAKGLLDLIRR